MWRLCTFRRMCSPMIRAVCFAFPLLLLLSACGSKVHKGASLPLATGPWRMVMNIDTTGHVLELPFQFTLSHGPAGWAMVVHNQDEAIQVDSVSVAGDSIRIRMPFFDSEFRGAIAGDSLFSGVWANYYKGPHYTIPFTAVAGVQPRFKVPASKAGQDISGDWEVHFINPGEADEPAIGIFSIEDGRVKGSFATETGDLRFLEGIIGGDSLFLSSFNGSQAYLFRAALHGDSITGEFRSGKSHVQRWRAVRNAQFALANDETLTELDPAHAVDFSFSGPDGRLHTLADKQYQGKVVVLDIMGTWCPNCIDEARLLKELHGKYNAQGLEVVALSFERSTDTAVAMAALRRFRNNLGIPYTLLLAGTMHRDSVAMRLPYIKQLKAYPTTILVGRNGQVRHIYTGIYGPGTGARYSRFRERMENALVDLLREQPRKGA